FVKTEMTADAVFLLSLLCAAGGHSASHHGSFHPHAIASLAHSIGKQITLFSTVGNTFCSVEALNDQKRCFYNALQVTNSLASGQIRACVVRYFLFELSGIDQTLEF
ncbi:MAG: hypothetical protein IJ240_00670, partial [Clostridia bacterium]|nr:hypothetical protein [Clostridia bacterium]